MRGRTMLVAALALASGACTKETGEDMGAASAAQAGGVMMDAAEYTFVFRNNWTATNHPIEFPSNAHFSGIVGATHGPGYSLFRDGSMPTPGLEMLSEMGKPTPLDEEIKAAMPGGSVGALFTTGPLRELKDSIVGTFRVDAAHRMVSFVAMIAPSPDWFTGAADVDLSEGGQWVASKTLQLYAWDSGGDDGATYKAADMDNNPKKATSQSMSRHFVRNGAAVPVATVTITKK